MQIENKVIADLQIGPTLMCVHIVIFLNNSYSNKVLKNNSR